MSHALRSICIIAVRALALASLSLTLAGCGTGNYRFVLNDNVLYDPDGTGNPAANVLRDPALQACLSLQLEASDNRDLTQVKLLACPENGVETLAGIGSLPALEQLEISNNKITDLRPLGQLKNLRVLGLRNNPVDSLSALSNLQLLRFLSLQGSEKLPCKEIAALKARLGNTLAAPDHCRE